MRFAYDELMAKKKPSTTANPRPDQVNVPIRMPRALQAEVEEVSEATGLSNQDTMRQALKRGLPILKRLLTMETEAIEQAA